MSATQQLTKEPSTFRAGTTVEWPKSLSLFPASDGWTLSYRLINISNAYAAITAAADGDDFIATLPAATTANYVAGNYTLFGYATKGSETFEIYNGSVEVQPNLAALTAGYDGRSHAKKVLDAIEALIEGNATQIQRSMSVGSKSLENHSKAELREEWLKYKKYYADELAQQKINNGQPSGRKILIRMGRAS